MFEKLVNLERLELQYNAFTGTIPASIGGLKAIKKLHMYSNSLSGSLPIFLLHSLLLPTEKLTLDKNSLVGSIPNGLFNITYLETLTLSENSFTGQISPRFGEFSYMKEMIFKDNLFSGYIPGELINLLDLGMCVLSKAFFVPYLDLCTQHRNLTITFLFSPSPVTFIL
mmetsp:Transcript_19030/g.28304  ORF Transcript_19030/g.28304 Transcript_19030/m.28304 type:complete len:169 (-) Transcript_19030:948-1454(-)